MKDEDEIKVEWEPIVRSNEDITRYIREVSGDQYGSTRKKLAQDISSLLALEQPEFFAGGYEALSKGTAPIYDLLEGMAELPPSERRLSDEQILRTFLVNEDGKPMRAGSFAEGFKREAPKQVGAFGGAYAGAKLGATMTAGVPPVSPPTIALKFGVPLVTTLVGAIGGQSAIDYFQEKLIGEEELIMPGTTADEESGKTAATVAGFFATPFAISKNINFGAAQYLDNLAQMNAVGPSAMAARAYKGDQAAMAAIDSPAMQEAIRTGGKGTRSMRFIRGAERMLSKTGEEARKNPVLTAVAEAGAGTGITMAAGAAEEAAPGQTLPRIAAETVGGLIPSIAVPAIARGVSTLYTNRDKLKPFLNDVKERFNRGGIREVFGSVRDKRLMKATDRIRMLLESQDEDVDGIIEALEATGRSLVDENGKPLSLTAGGKAGSPTLLAIEKALEEMAPRLGEERSAAAQAANDAIRAQVLLMITSGDKQALEASATSINDVFVSALTNRLSRRNEKLLEAFETLAGEDQRSNAQLSQALFEIAESELKKARVEESRLWESIPEYTIDLFGAEQPAFITAWRDSIPQSPRAREFVLSRLQPLARFVEDKLGDMNNFETMVDAGLSSTELIEMRSVANTLNRELLASGDRNGARIAGNFASGLLEDLGRIADEDLRLSYMAAREFSKALNDVYTRAFVGDVLDTQKTGELTKPPELLMKEMLQGGADPTLIRIRDMQKIGQFAADQGLEGAEQTMANIDTVYEAMLRSARATAFDPSISGKVNQTALNRWMVQNSELLEMFPALQSDLKNLNTAQTLFTRTAANNKRRQAKINRLISFQNLMGENADSPVFAVQQALSSKRPNTSLNTLVRIAKSAPEEQRAGSMRALQDAIMEALMTSGGVHSKNFKASELWKNLTLNRPGMERNMLDYMKDTGLMSEKEAQNLDSMLREMIRYEAGLQGGNIENLAEDAGPIFELLLRISGAKLGTMGSDLLGGGNQSLVAAGAGSKAMREVFQNMPLALQMDVMLDLMRDPQLLATFLKKPKNEKEKLKLADVVMDYFKKKGVDIVRRPAPSIPREVEASIEEKMEASPVEVESPMPSTTGFQGGRPQPRPPQPSKPLVQIPPPMQTGAPNPQQRAQYAALFPDDPTSEMIRGGIGSLG